MMNWSDVSFTIGGVPFPVEHVAYCRKPYDPKADGVDVLKLTPKRDYSFEYTCTMEAKAGWGLLNLFPPPPRGASNFTLAKRMHYGGRKGRSAWRRLRAQGFAGILKINDEDPVPCPPIRILAP